LGRWNDFVLFFWLYAKHYFTKAAQPPRESAYMGSELYFLQTAKHWELTRQDEAANTKFDWMQKALEESIAFGDWYWQTGS
jgi:hypothetical protein